MRKSVEGQAQSSTEDDWLERCSRKLKGVRVHRSREADPASVMHLRRRRIYFFLVIALEGFTFRYGLATPTCFFVTTEAGP